MSDYAYRPHYGNNIREGNLRNFMRQFPIVFFISAEPDICAKRMEDRGDLNEFEKAHVLGKIKEIRDAYVYTSKKKFEEFAYADDSPARWYTVDNNSSIEIAFKQIVGLLAYNFSEFTDVIDIVKTGGLI
jgi:thymidylate kinase